tara:strand:- start:187 stop:384 length:198 start_codon:yes stop_codon:yes gene_type:complete
MSRRPTEIESWAPKTKNTVHLNQSNPVDESEPKKPSGKMKIIDDHFMRRSEQEFVPKYGKKPIVY